MSVVSEAPSPAVVPVHVAIIMDGNGRWATARGLPRSIGHKRGAEAVRRVVKAAAGLGIAHLTLFGFSSENWKRPAEEIRELMGLLRLYLSSEIAELHRNGVRLRVFGDRSRLSADIAALIDSAEQRTRGNTRISLNIALSYGARAELTAAMRSIAAEVAAGRLAVTGISEATIEAALLTSDLPDPDLLIRTSGEQRLSNFLLWQSAYTELVFLDTLWPDFDKSDLEDAIREFSRRERRFGACAASV